MGRAAAWAVTSLYQLAWAVWLGGIVILGAVSAPAVFRSARAWPDASSSEAVLRFAGVAAGEGFRRFNYVALACGAAMLVLGLIHLGLVRPRLAGVHLLRLLLTAAALGITVWLTFRVFPEMISFRSAGNSARFNALHQLYEQWTMRQSFILLASGALSGVLAIAGYSRPPVSPGKRTEAAGAA